MSREFVVAAWIVSLFVPLAAVAPASAEGLGLSGIVAAQGEPVAGAEVRIADAQGNPLRSVLTAEDGTFSFADLAPGRVGMTVEAAGFVRESRTIQLASTRSDVRVELQPVGLETEITVTAALPDFIASDRIAGGRIEAQGAPDLVAALRGEPGLAATRRGSINLEPSVRGLQEGEVGMFVDGSRTFAAGPARMDSDLSHVGPHSAQNVRVVKGPYALTWGAGTMSAIDVQTFRPPFTGEKLGLGGNFGLQYSDNGSVTDTIGSLWGSSESLRFEVSAAYREGSDYEGGSGTEVPGDFESTDLLWGVGWQIRPSVLFDYNGLYQAQDGLDYPGRLLDATYFRTHGHRLQLDALLAGGGEIAAQLSSSRKDHEMNNDEKPTAFPDPSRIPPFGVNVVLPTESDTLSGRFSWSSSAGDWRLKAGGDFYALDQSATRTISRRPAGPVLFEDIVWPDARIDDVGVYLQGQRGFARSQVGATVRVDRVDASAGEVSDFFRANTEGNLDQREKSFSLAFSAVFELGERWLLSAGAGRAVRTASVLERYSDRLPSTKFQLPAEFMGAPAIDPERSTELDLGAEARFGGLHLRADAFYRVIDDYITVAPDPSLPRRLPLSPPVVFRYLNGTQATFFGGELTLDQSVGERFEWRGWLSYVHAQDEAFDEPVLGIPPQTGVVELEIHSRDHRYALDLVTTMAAAQNRVAASRFEQPTPGYTVFDLRGVARVASTWSVRAGVENLTDRAYSQHLDSPNPYLRERIPARGRSFFLAVRFESP